MRIWPWLWFLAYGSAKAATWFRLRRRFSFRAALPDGALLFCSKHGAGWDIPLLSQVAWKLRKERPYFQMGSFIGYPILGFVTPFLKRLGGFPVMRPKEALRLKNKLGQSKEDALGRMEKVNSAAETMRRELLRERLILIVFPEGTRDATQLRPFRSEVELGSALAVQKEGTDVFAVPISIAYGQKRFFRRDVEIIVDEAFPLKNHTESSALKTIEAAIQKGWRPPEAMTT